MSKHTPGPWRALNDSREDWSCVVNRHDYTIARGMKAADARLIAAAPEMLEEIARLKLQYQSSQEALTECQEELVEVTDMLRDLVSNPRRGLFPADALKRARALLAKVDDNG